MDKPEKILVVDDHEDIRVSLVDILEARGHKACGAVDGQDAVNKVRRSPFCLVIMDIRMPRKDGIQALKEIKQLRPDTPVILISAFAVERWAVGAAEQGPVAAFTKPLDMERLLGLVDQYCGCGAGG